MEQETMEQKTLRQKIMKQETMEQETLEQKEKKNQEYNEYVKQVTPTHSLPANMAKAFLTGGAICVLGQFILDRKSVV